ncbi:hypothetical protein BH24DEI2_BH24DEI2_05740 [soil metagenome]
MTALSRAPRWGRNALIAGVVGLVAAVVVAFLSGAGAFFESYLYAFIFWTGLALGCLVMLAVQHLAGGSWGALIRRPLEAGALLIPLMALLFIPLLFGLGHLYEWTHADYVASHPTVAAKAAYLNVPFFIIRSALYFAIWTYGAFYFFRASQRQDRDEATSLTLGFKLKSAGAAWIIIYVVTMTFAMVDWSMSLTPEFFSGIYSVIYMIGQAISAVCFVVFVMVALARANPKVDELLTPKRLQDLGNFLMAFTMFWAYTSFAQLIILWSNNVIETNPYYVLRFSPSWRVVGLFLIFFGFAAPFAVLFSRWVKRKRRALVAVAVWAMFIRLLDVFFTVIPNFGREGFPLHLLDVLLLVGIGGLWLGVFSLVLSSRPVLPLYDPRLLQPDRHAHDPRMIGADHA